MKLCTTCGKEWPDEFKLCPADGSSLRSASAPEDLVDTVIADRYLILKKLGQGGMGTVYLGEHVKMGQRAAIKVISRHLASDPSAIARFNREARNAAQIKHPNVCMVHDFGETPDGLIYMAMEFIEGESLADILHREGRMTLGRAADILMQCCDALQSAHDLDIVHRDIKPENIMMTKGRDDVDVVKVVDFGIAKAVTQESGQTVTQTGFIVGTPDYMSPDQVSGEILDGRSDIYSLAVVFYRMVTGVLPFKTETPHDALMARLAGKPISLAEALPKAGFPPALQQVLDKALAQKRDQRYGSAIEFGKAIQAAVRDATGATMIEGMDSAATYKLPTPQPVARPSAPTTPETPQPRPAAPKAPAPRSRAPLLAAAAIIILGGGGFAAWQLTKGGQPGTVTVVGISDSAAPEVPDSAATVADAPAEAAPAAAVTPTNGTVVIADLPRGGTIALGGRQVTSPISLPAGQHTLELRAPGFQPKRVTVDVTAGERQTVIYAAQPITTTQATTQAPPPAAPAEEARRRITIGTTSNSTLTSSDLSVQGRYAQAWTLPGRAGQRVSITMRSGDFDTFLYLRGPGLNPQLEDDDGADGLNSRITTVLPETGAYQIIATTLGQGRTGAYTLSVDETAAPVAPTGARTVAMGQQVRGSLQPGAPQFEGRRAEAWSLTVPRGTAVEINMTADFDTYLYLTGPGIQTLSNDDGGPGSNARIVATLPGGTYTVYASAYSSSATGDYTLFVREPLTLASLPRPSAQPLTVGGSTTGTLTQRDPEYGGRHVQVYQLRGQAGAQVTIALQSEVFDTYLYFSGPGLDEMTNDDGGNGTNSQISVRLPQSGTYYIGVAGFSTSHTGRFTLSAR